MDTAKSLPNSPAFWGNPRVGYCEAIDALATGGRQFRLACAVTS